MNIQRHLQCITLTLKLRYLIFEPDRLSMGFGAHSFFRFFIRAPGGM